jgi:hypothetical protein
MKRKAFALLLESLLALRRENKDVLWSSMVKDTMKRKKPSFNETYHGYRTFSELLEDAQKEGLVEIEKHRVVRAPLVQLERLPSADRQRRRELRSGEDAAYAFGVVPVGVENEDAFLIGGQTAHGTDYIDDRANPAIVARFGLQVGQSDRSAIWRQRFCRGETRDRFGIALDTFPDCPRVDRGGEATWRARKQP